MNIERHATAALTSGKRPSTIVQEGCVRTTARSGRVRKTSPRQDFDPQTVQPAADRYTDWVIPARNGYNNTRCAIL